MSGIPAGVILPFVGVVIVVVMLAQRRLAARRDEAAHPGFRAGELARRLGLELVEGDPGFNLFITHASPEIARGPRDGRPVRVRARCKGVRDGVPLELIYDLRWERHSGVATTTWRRWLECGLVAGARTVFPAFEVRSRHAQPAPIASLRALAPSATGNAAVDSAYAIATEEPRLAQLLSRHLGGFAALGGAGVHLIGDGQTITFVMRQDKAPLLSSVLYYADEVATALVEVARAVGG